MGHPELPMQHTAPLYHTGEGTPPGPTAPLPAPEEVQGEAQDSEEGALLYEFGLIFLSLWPNPWPRTQWPRTTGP